MMSQASASHMREDFADALNRVAYGRERIVLYRRKKKVAALIPIEDFDLLQELENRLDLETARAALKEKGSIPWKKLKAELGL